MKRLSRRSWVWAAGAAALVVLAAAAVGRSADAQTTAPGNQMYLEIDGLPQFQLAGISGLTMSTSANAPTVAVVGKATTVTPKVATAGSTGSTASLYVSGGDIAALAGWIQLAQQHSNAAARSMTITTYLANGAEGRRWNITNAFPLSLEFEAVRPGTSQIVDVLRVSAREWKLVSP